MEELAEAAVRRIDAPQQLALVEAKAEHTVRLALSGRPFWLLLSQDDCQTVKIREHCLVDRSVEGK